MLNCLFFFSVYLLSQRDHAWRFPYFGQKLLNQLSLLSSYLSPHKALFHHLLQKETCLYSIALTDLINVAEQLLSVLDLNFPPNSALVDALCWNERCRVIESGFCQHINFVCGHWVKPHLSMQYHDRLAPNERKSLLA